MPNPSGSLLGGHAVLIVGYSDERECFLIRNSWGSDWGMSGHFMMSYDFIVSRYCTDFWLIETVKDTETVTNSPKIKRTSRKKHKEIPTEVIEVRYKDYEMDSSSDSEKEYEKV